MYKFSVYNAAGDFVRSCRAPDSSREIEQLLADDEVGIIEEHYSEGDDYYDLETRTIKKKVPMALSLPEPPFLADSATLYALSGIPDPCIVTVISDDEIADLLVEDGVLELTFDLAGEYVLEFKSPAHHFERIVFNAV